MVSHDSCILVVHSSPTQAFSNPRHPLGILMNRLEMVYHASYGGIGANKYLLPHAIAETHSLIKRIHTIVRYGGINWNTHNGELQEETGTALEPYATKFLPIKRLHLASA